jgi:GMP synthase (glutamine-hydrolysing)
MAKDLVLVRHGDDPPDDRVVTFAVQAGFNPVLVRPFRGDRLGLPGASVAGSVIYGGPFSVFEEDRHPFLHDEAAWIRACMAQGIPLLGICQGAQQIARVLGAHVGPPASGVHEFGYYPISPTPEGRDFLPQTLHMTQAHFHTFDIPQGAVRLAGSPLYPNQAFRHGEKTYGVQFHPECTIEGFRRWQATPWAAYGKPGAQTREEQDRLMAEHDAAQAEWFYGFLARLFGRAA